MSKLLLAATAISLTIAGTACSTKPAPATPKATPDANAKPADPAPQPEAPKAEEPKADAPATP